MVCQLTRSLPLTAQHDVPVQVVHIEHEVQDLGPCSSGKHRYSSAPLIHIYASTPVDVEGVEQANQTCRASGLQQPRIAMERQQYWLGQVFSVHTLRQLTLKS